MASKTENFAELHILFLEKTHSSFSTKQAKQIISETESALIRLVLVPMGFAIPSDQKNVTKELKNAAIDFMSTLPLKQLPKAEKRFEVYLPQSPLSKKSRNTYGSRARYWFAWAKDSGFYPGEPMSEELAAQCAPHSLHGHGSVNKVHITRRRGVYKAYALKLEEMNPSLRKWYEEISQFLIQPKQPGRMFPAIKLYTLKLYQRGWRLILGWQHRYNGIPLEELGPQHIFPTADLDEFEALLPDQQKRFWRTKNKELEAILCGYHNFLLQEMKSYSPETWHAKLTCILAAGRFFYADWVSLGQEYYQLPPFKILKANRQENREQTKERALSPDVAGLDQKWPDVPDGSTAVAVFFNRVMAPMSDECKPRAYSRKLRSARKLAHRHQQLLRVGIGGGIMPTLRQEADRSLKIALSCPIKRPPTVPKQGVYYPLPPDEIRERNLAGKITDNYLYFTYSLDGRPYKDGVWVRQVREQKTSKSLGIHQTIIPDRVFPNGATFYQHIESYLEGVWWPLSKPSPSLTPYPYQWDNPRYKGTQGNWMTAGRSTFDPKDTQETDATGADWRVGYLFVSPTRGLPYSETLYIEAIRCNAHRLIGKAITPHTMRYFWATWGWQVSLSDTELRSLAYMMGHSVETLRNMYMKVTPIEKQQPIEDAINARLYVPDGDADRIPLNKLLRALSLSTKDERLQLFMHLKKLMNDGGDSPSVS